MDHFFEHLNEAKYKLKVASSIKQEQENAKTIFQQKNTMALKNLHKFKGKMKPLQEELQHSQQKVFDC